VRENFDLVRENSPHAIRSRVARHFTELDGGASFMIRERDQLTPQHPLSKEFGAFMREAKKTRPRRRRPNRAPSPKSKRHRGETRQIDNEFRAILTAFRTCRMNRFQSAPTNRQPGKSAWGRRAISPPKASSLKTRRSRAGLGHSRSGARGEVDWRPFAVLCGLGRETRTRADHFMLDLHTKEHGYRETLPPFIVNNDSLFRHGTTPEIRRLTSSSCDFERDYYLVPDRRVPLTNLHRDEI